METNPRPPSIGGGRSSVVESLLRTEFLPVTPAEDETPYEKVVNELVATECTFVVNLRLVLEVYYWPLRNLLRGPEMMPMTPEIATAFAEFTEPILNSEELTKLYGCLEQLFPVNAGLLKDFQSAQQIPKESSNGEPNPDSLYNNIGKLFYRFVHFFKMYSLYCCSYEASATFLGELLTAEKYAPFQKFCNIAMNLPRAGGATLASFLIQPVQRVPRYILIFKELVKYAPTSNHIVHETLRKELQAALKEAATVAGRINEEVRARKNRDEIVALSALFWDDPQFIGPSRRLIRQGPLVRECRGGNKLFTFFLFNDTLAYAEKLVIGKYKLHRKLPIDDSFQINADLEEYKTVGYKQSVYALEVVSLQKTFRVFFTTEAQKNEWVDDIEDQMEELKLQRARKRPTDLPSPSLGTTTSAVRMLPHSPDSVCFGCGTTFSLLKPAVNCTLCGQIFCKKCTKTQVTLNVAKRGTTGENQGEKENIKSRSCEPCAQARLTATRERLRMKSHQSRTLGWSGLYEAMGVERKPGEGTDFGEVLSYVPRTDIEQKLSAESRTRSMTDPTHSEQDAPPLEPADGTSVYDSAQAQPDLLGRRPRNNRIKPQILSIFEQLELQSDQLSSLQKDRKAFTFDPSTVRTPALPPVVNKPTPPPATLRKISSQASSSASFPLSSSASTSASSLTVNNNNEAKGNSSHEKAFVPPPLVVSSPVHKEDFQSPPPLNRSVKTPLGKKPIPKYATIGHTPRSKKEEEQETASTASVHSPETPLEKIHKPVMTTGANFAKLRPVGTVTPPLKSPLPTPITTTTTSKVSSSTSTTSSMKDSPAASTSFRSPLAGEKNDNGQTLCENCRASVGDAKFCPSCGHKSSKVELTSTPKFGTANVSGGKVAPKPTDILAASRSRSTEPRSPTTQSIQPTPSSAIRTPSNGPKPSPRVVSTNPGTTIDDLLSKPAGRVRPTTEACTKCKTLRSGDKAFCNSCGQKFA